MAEQAVYVPHSLGTVIGSRQHRPWLARDADGAIEQTATPPWRGQPVFATAGDAWAWIEWARAQDWLPDGLAVAHIHAQTDLSTEGLRRVHVGLDQVRNPANQVVRPYPGAPGPDPQILAACHGVARAEALRSWMLRTIGATASEQRHAALSTVWTHGYHIAARDTRASLAEHLGRAVRAVLADPTSHATRDDGVAALQPLARAADDLAATAGNLQVPDLDQDVLHRAVSAGSRESSFAQGWVVAMTLVWKEALRLGALLGPAQAVDEIRRHWRANGPAITARIQARPADRWFTDLAVDTNRTSAQQWLLTTAAPLDPPPPQPDAASTPMPPQPTTRGGSEAPPTPQAPAAGKAFTTPSTVAGPPTPPASASPPHNPPGLRR